MRHIFRVLKILLIFITICCARTAQAQTSRDISLANPEVEISGGYGQFATTPSITGTRQRLNGVTCSGSFFGNGWLALTIECGAYQAKIAPSGQILKLSAFEFGPTIRIPIGRRVAIYGHALVGGGIAAGSIYSSSIGIPLRSTGTSDAHVRNYGVGVEIALTPRFRWHPLELELVHSRYQNVDNNFNHQESYLISTSFSLMLHPWRSKR